VPAEAGKPLADVARSLKGLPVLAAQRTTGAIMAFKFQNFDFLHLDSGFSEDELLVRRTARDFVEDNIVPIIEDCFRVSRGSWFR
jgi:hypothetical protein